MKPERLARTVIYESPWVNLYVDRVRFPSGRIIEHHHLLDFRPSVVVLIENENSEILLVRICRYTTGATSWELPAGGMEAGEPALEAARREALEETGYHTLGHQQVYSYYPMDGLANKLVHIIRCRAGERVADFDAGEVSEARWFSWLEIERMIQNGEMTCGVSLAALLLCLRE